MTDIEHIAKLARLELTEDEKGSLGHDITAILEHVKTLQDLDLSDVSPTASPVPNLLRLRPDEPQESLTQEEALANAPEVEKQRFKVPPMLEAT